MEQTYLTGIVTEKPQNFAWFLGAGASRSAGLPTAWDIIWELKRQYFTREESEKVSRQDIQIAAVRERIQAFMISRGFPKDGDFAEYETYFEIIFGTDRERQRSYLVRVLNEEKATLSVGNRVMGALLGADYCKAVFTTNFNSIVEKAVAEVTARSLAAFHIEGSRASVQALNNNEFPLYCKLHGDYRYDSIKNLKEDLSNQNKELANCFQLACTRFGFVVAGYSGRDASVMALFKQALDGPNPFPHGLYWTGIKGAPIPSAVTELLDYAKTKNVSAHHVAIETYDALMLRIWRNLRAPPDLDAKVRKTKASTVSIALPLAGTKKPSLGLNALPITRLPSQCHRLIFSQELDWKKVKDIQRMSEGSLVLTRADGVWCWGGDTDIKTHCAALKSKEVLDLTKLLPTISEHLLLKGFLEEALAKALVRGKPLLARSLGPRNFIIADAHTSDRAVFTKLHGVVSKTHGTVPDLVAPIDEFHREEEKVTWAEALRVSIDEKAGRYWLVVDPDIWIWPTRARRIATEFMSDRRKVRFNKMYDDLINAWIQLLFAEKNSDSVAQVSAFATGSAAENPSFEISTNFAFSLGKSA